MNQPMIRKTVAARAALTLKVCSVVAVVALLAVVGSQAGLSAEGSEPIPPHAMAPAQSEPSAIAPEYQIDWATIERAEPIAQF